MYIWVLVKLWSDLPSLIYNLYVFGTNLFDVARLRCICFLKANLIEIVLDYK